MTLTANEALRPRRARASATTVFPVPTQRLAVVDLTQAIGGRPAVSAMTHRLSWPTLLLQQPDEFQWALTVNRPAAVLVLLGDDEAPDPATVEAVRRATKAPMAVLGELSGSQSVAFLASGADVLLSPTTREEELGAHLLSLVRRASETAGASVRYLSAGPLRVDLWQREVTLDEQPVALSSTHFKLLVCLMESAGQLVPSNRLIAKVWGWAGADEGLNTLRIAIARLRRALNDPSGTHRFVASVRGSGYRFVPAVTEVGPREETPSDPVDSTDGRLAERLARRCAELASTTDPALAADHVTRALVSEGTVDAVGLHLVDGDRLRLLAHHGFSAAWETAALELRLADQGFAAVRTLSHEEPLQVRRFGHRSGFDRTAELARVELPGTYLFVPLRSGQRVVGVMGLHRHSSEPFGPMSITYLKAVAALCAVCLNPPGAAEA